MIYSNFTGRVAKKAKVIDGVNGQFLRYYSNELGIVPGSLLLTSIQRKQGRVRPKFWFTSLPS